MSPEVTGQFHGCYLTRGTGPPKIPLEVILGKIDPISGFFLGRYWRSYPDCPPLPQNFEVLSGLYGISFEIFYKIYKKISYYLNHFLK